MHVKCCMIFPIPDWPNENQERNLLFTSIHENSGAQKSANLNWSTNAEIMVYQTCKEDQCIAAVSLHGVKKIMDCLDGTYLT